MESTRDEEAEVPKEETTETETTTLSSREICINGVSLKTADIEAKLDEGNFQEAESCIRDGLSLNSEVLLPNFIVNDSMFHLIDLSGKVFVFVEEFVIFRVLNEYTI